MDPSTASTQPAQDRSAPLLTINEVATRLGATPRFVRRLVADRRIVFHRIGKFIRFDPVEIEALVEEGRVERCR
jgi:excisionase family DNA binding protein